MLVLARKAGESILLGGHDTIQQPGGHKIKIVVVDIKGNSVRLGLEAGTDIAIIRDELLQKDPPKDAKGPELAQEGSSEESKVTVKEH